MPWAVLPAVALFAAVTAVWGYVSLGSLTASLAAPVSAYLIGYPAVHAAMALVVAVFVFIRHRENISRLISGRENKFRGK
jgi:glycerol-3-phosphate acyltransferase PlsY